MAQENFVTRDVFDSEIKRIEQKVDNSIERIELKMDVYTAKMEGKFDTLNDRIDGIAAHLNSVVTYVNWILALTGIIIAVGTFVIQILLKITPLKFRCIISEIYIEVKKGSHKIL